MVRAVLDTNILVSGVLHLGNPKKLLDSVEEGKIELVSSAEIIEEFSVVISREKFRLSEDEQRLFREFITRLSTIIRVRSKFRVIKEDPDDDKIVEAAYDGKASYVVSGDRHLLDLGEFSGIKVVTASEMLKILGVK